MKKNDIKEILALGEKAISGKITELKKEVAKADLDLVRGKLKNVRERKTLKRAIAVLKTKLAQGAK
jgi:ribosomal protein L29